MPESSNTIPLGHIFNDCPLLSEIDRLYEVDRLKPSDSFDNYADITVTVSTPEFFLS